MLWLSFLSVIFIKMSDLSAAKTSPIIFETAGFNGRKNTVVAVNPTVYQGRNSFLVYFGGDIQDVPEKMSSHRDNSRYLKWNLLDTAKLLSKKFPSHHITVVRPYQLHLGTFAGYSNFVPSNNFGVPDYTADFSSFEHLRLLLTSVQQQLNNTRPVDQLILVGFSKGCVVLNQLLYDFQNLSGEENLDLLTKVTDLVWLDGGHSGGSQAWVTDKPVLQRFYQLLGQNCSVHVHLTPYQIGDSRRPWIGREEKIFSDTLKHLGFQLERKVHFQEEMPSLDNHFKLIEEFNLPL